MLALALSGGSFAQQKRAMTPEDLLSMKRIDNAKLSPDGKTVVFSATAYSMDKNKGDKDIYSVPAAGGETKKILEQEGGESEPQFIPGEDLISYIYKNQLYQANLDGSSSKQITDFYAGVDSYRWSNDGKKILFTASVYPDCGDEDCHKKKEKENEENPVKAKLYTELMYRHWNDWRGEKRSHLFLFDTEENKYYDLTPNSKYDVPPIALGSAEDFSFSPDGKEAAFVMNEDDFLSTSTNNDVFTIDISNPEAGNFKRVKLYDNNGNDNNPVYSPDGKYLAFLSMPRAGFEADKQNIIVYDRAVKSFKNYTENFNFSAAGLRWSPDSKLLYFGAATEINNVIYTLEIASGKISPVIKSGDNSLADISKDGKTLLLLSQNTAMPTEVFTAKNDGTEMKRLTEINKELLAQLEFTPAETFWSEGAESKVQSILIKPPFFDPNKKYPLIFLIHGGPQGNWADEFHYRWNYQLFAAQGYVVIATNFTGSTGYGQAFTDAISGDWGGKPYVDLMKALDYALANYNYIDKNNLFAAGASYGGYMINWLEGHTDRFNAVVSHAGVYNLESMYGSTEELWFPEWEFKGMPWTNPEMYAKFSPHKYAKNFKTPMLVVHGAFDFRVPESQGFELFTTLQRLNIKSKFLYFPDEFHFVNKPKNSILWWNTIFEWFAENKKEG